MYLSVFKNILSSEGRINRRQYLTILIPYVIIMATFSVAMINAKVDNRSLIMIQFISALFMIPTQIKRLHDMNMSGWLMLIALIPVLNYILAIGLIIVPGTKEKNKFGLPSHEDNNHSINYNDSNNDNNKYSSVQNDTKYTSQASYLAMQEKLKVQKKHNSYTTQKKYSSLQEKIHIQEKNLQSGSNKNILLLPEVLANCILNATVKSKSLSTLQEQLEMRYFFLFCTEFLIFTKLPQYREMITAKVLALVLNSTNSNKDLNYVISEYNNRTHFYMACEEVITEYGAIPGTQAFVLSHFLQKARGKTTGRDVTKVLNNTRKLETEDMPEFLRIYEMAPIVATIIQTLAMLEKITDEFKDKK